MLTGARRRGATRGVIVICSEINSLQRNRRPAGRLVLPRRERVNVGRELAQETGLAGRYAAALFELAGEHKAVDAVSADLAAFRKAMDANSDLARVVKSPVFSRENQGKALKAVLDKLGAGKLTVQFVLLLANKRRLFALTGIIRAYESLVAKARGETEAEVI